MYSSLTKLILWSVAVTSILIPIFVNLKLDHSLDWTISLLFPFIILVMYPSWTIAITAMIFGSFIKYFTELYFESSTFLVELPILVTSSIVDWFLFIVVSYFRISNHETSQRLEESKQGYKSLFEYNPNATYSLDLNGCFINGNPATVQIMGYSVDELIGTPFVTHVVPDFLEKTKDCFVKAAHGEAQRYESAIYHKEGQIFCLCVANVPILVNNNIVGVFGIAIDETEKRKVEKALKDSEERYRKLVEMSPQGIVVHRDGEILYANLSSKISMKDENPIGQSIFSYIHPDSHEMSQQRASQLEVGTELPFTEMKLIRRDGKIIDADVGGMSITYDGGPATLTMFRDITERKLFEDKLRHMAYHDPLTGLPNRRLFKETLRQAISNADRYERNIAVMYLDLDRFKQINDTLGHDIGDELLKLFSQRVKGCLRESDMLARLGGDEFAVFLETSCDMDITTVAEKIIVTLQKQWVIGEHDFTTTSSIGIAVYEKY